jgi:chromosome partitioning protein
VHIVQASGKINDTLMEMAKKYDCVAVDLQGRDSSEQRTAMMVADKLLIPVRPSQYDLDTLLPFLDIVRTAQDFNPRLVAKVVLSCCSTHPSKKEFHDAQSYVHGTGIELVGAHTCERKVYRDSAAEGKSIFECADRKAIAEMELLIGEILK